jgi:hypothetical protein
MESWGRPTNSGTLRAFRSHPMTPQPRHVHSTSQAARIWRTDPQVFQYQSRWGTESGNLPPFPKEFCPVSRSRDRRRDTNANLQQLAQAGRTRVKSGPRKEIDQPLGPA